MKREVHSAFCFEYTSCEVPRAMVTTKGSMNEQDADSLSNSLGEMTRSPEDFAPMPNVLLGDSDYTQYLGKRLDGFKIGILDPLA